MISDRSSQNSRCPETRFNDFGLRGVLPRMADERVEAKLRLYRNFKPPFFWPEQYRRTGGMSIVFLFDENPDVASAGSGGAAVGGARSVPDQPADTRTEVWEGSCALLVPEW